MANYHGEMIRISRSGKSLDEKMRLYEALIKQYYAEQRDSTARDKAKLGPSNLDPDNPVIKEAEDYSKSIQNPKFKKTKQ